MLNILTYNLPELTTALRSGCFRRAGLRLTVASDERELCERAAVLMPNIVILDAGVSAHRIESGLARTLRGCLADARSWLLLALPHERRDLDEDLRFYDGILSLEEAASDLLRLLSANRSFIQRQSPRAPVDLLAQL